ncbi:MAG: S8 family serine peptidase, partial [Deltaproteobacteria bacterium]|nr:S8 family serine peptidase [Deltaproteobacteria bacterium]
MARRSPNGPSTLPSPRPATTPGPRDEGGGGGAEMRRGGALALLIATAVLAAANASRGEAAAQMPDPALVVTSGDASMPPRWPRRPLAGTAMEASGVLRVRDRAGLDGTGATVCVVDSGVDLGHRDFQDAGGRTRVSWHFDFTDMPRGSHPELEARFGAAVYRGDELDAELDPPGDSNGHGTAVASIAVGDDAAAGETAPGPNAGAAPDAALIVVKLPMIGGIGFEDASIIAGVTACFAVGDPSRTVAVVSLGGHDGRHDGTEPIDVALDALAATGARIVVSAGNDGARPIHASATLGRRATAPLSLFVPAPQPASPDRFVAVAITGEAGTRVTVHAPDGTSVGPVPYGEQAEATGPRSHVIIDGTIATSPRTGGIYVVIGGTDGGAFGGDYRIDVEARGRLDAWIIDADVGAAVLGPRFTGPFVAPGGTVTIPGTARGVITVGASIGRTMVSTDASVISIGGDVNGVATFSSTGPAPGAAPKPDLVAPAALVLAALTSDLSGDDTNNIVGGSAQTLARHRVGPDRIAVTGTSFAAPLVAGVVALGLGASTSAAVNGVDLDRLRFTSRPLGDAPWEGGAGFGVVDALAFIEGRAAPPEDGFRVDLRATAPIDSGNPRLFLAGRAMHEGAPFDGIVELFLEGEQVGSVPSSEGLVAAPITAPITAPGESVTLEARIGGETRGTVVVRARIDAARERRPPAAGGGGGCATSGPPRALALWFFAVWFVGRSIRR